MKSNMKTIAAFALSVMLVFTMTPTTAFAVDSEADYTTDSEDEVLRLQEEAFEETDRDLAMGEFVHDGTAYIMEDISGYSQTMRIYAFYLGTGEDGDAVLIESNGKYLLMDTGHKRTASRLVSCLKQVMGSEKKLDVYFSHMHGDHTGGLEKVLLNFQVERVFFPDI